MFKPDTQNFQQEECYQVAYMQTEFTDNHISSFIYTQIIHNAYIYICLNNNQNEILFTQILE
jgi:hypothetical protein